MAASTTPTSTDGAPARRMLPDRFRTQICRHFARTGACNFGEHCFFAHGENQLRSRESNQAAGLSARPIRRPRVPHERQPSSKATSDERNSPPLSDRGTSQGDAAHQAGSAAPRWQQMTAVTVGERVVGYVARTDWRPAHERQHNTTLLGAASSGESDAAAGQQHARDPTPVNLDESAFSTCSTSGSDDGAFNAAPEESKIPASRPTQHDPYRAVARSRGTASRA